MKDQTGFICNTFISLVNTDYNTFKNNTIKLAVVFDTVHGLQYVWKLCTPSVEKELA